MVLYEVFYICSMKKRTVFILGLIMGFSFLALLALELMYLEEMVSMRRKQFDESVKRSLYSAAHKLEVHETMAYLEKDLAEAEKTIQRGKKGLGVVTHQYNYKNDGLVSSFEMRTIVMPQRPKQNNNITDASRSLQEVIRSRYVHQRSLMEEAINKMLYTASDKPLEQRINFQNLDRELHAELQNNGIDIPYHFAVSTSDGREVYRCSDYESAGEEHSYSQILFSNDPPNKMGVLKIHFPTMNSYIFSSVRFVIPALFFTIVLCVTFIYTLFIIFRQKKVTELKNDFINNMTHEFKTPISTISLAAQMLTDNSVSKSPQMLQHITGIISDESRRLRFQVEKVLQVSLFDEQKASLKTRELDMNELVTGVVNTFALKVEKNSGTIVTQLEAEDPMILADEMHITNVVFNLMDNAVKYKRDDESLRLTINTWNEPDKFCLSIQDNGLGIKKENLKRVFERFYRVHTGNVHDVKGFGLGLAYVKKVIQDHRGTISVESELGVGTKFIIVLPLLNSK